MPDSSEPIDPRSNLIESLLERQDEVIRELDDLEKRLIETIENVRLKDEDADKELISENATSEEESSISRAA
jgi:hypothetical protein